MTSILRPHRMGILLLLIAVGTVAALSLTPALPQLSRDFGVSASEAQLTISIFLIGYALGQLPYGPIANRFGRKKAIFIGMGLMLAGSLLAIASSSFWVLLLSRFIQALGAAVGLKITFTMVSDQHEGNVATRAISLLSLAFAITPPLAVAIGGYLTEYWNWQACFIFTALYAVILGALTFALPETSKQLNPEALQIKKIACAYGRQFKRGATVLNGLQLGMISATFYIYATLAPYIGIEQIGLSPGRYGLWNLTLCVGLFLGVAFTRWAAGKDASRLAAHIGILIMGLASAAMIVCFYLSLVNVWTLFLIGSGMRIGSNAIWSSASTHSLSTSHDKSNTSAVMLFTSLSSSTAGTLLVGLFPTNQVMVLPVTLGIIIVLLVFIQRQAEKSAV